MKGAAEPDVISDVMCARRGAGQSSASSADQPPRTSPPVEESEDAGSRRERRGRWTANGKQQGLFNC